MEPQTDTPPAISSPKRRWKKIAPAGALAVVLAAGAAYAVSRSEGSETVAPETEATIRAVEAEQRDLVEYSEIDGTLQYANVTTVAADRTGTITALVNDGDPLVRGDVAYEVNAMPVSVFYGDVPLYRALAEGSEGDDVLLLESNLASLGYHATEDDDGEEVDTGFTVDGVFDAATTSAVLRWQADLGTIESGTVEPADVLVVAGPATAAAQQVDLGSRVQPGSPVMNLNLVGTVDGFYSQHSGSIELQIETGEVANGQVLYTANDLPVIAIVTTEALDRDLSDGVEDGDDIAVVEQMLLDLGYDADGDLEVDDRFDEATTRALEDWEEDLQDSWDDVVVDGILSRTEFVVAEPATTVGSITGRESETVATGSELFTFGSDSGTRVVTTAIDVDEQEKLAEGQLVDVEFPDGSIVTGTVTEVASSSTKDPLDPDAEASLAVEITLESVPDSVVDLNELDVVVKLVERLATDATVVPAAALLATADGGFAVEVVNGTNTSFVAVDPGMFADGFVQVDGLSPGAAVVVPS